MPRSPDGLYPRTRRVTFRLTEPDEEAVDLLRGDTSRSEYIRSLIVADQKRHNRRKAKETDQ